MIKNINNNKIIMITHIADIDGMGSLILAKKHYSNIDYILCEINELIEVFSSIDYSKYEIIYVCDLALSKTILDYLNKHPEITNKIKHFDHHEIIENSPYYVNSIIYLNDKPTCGTQLFYNYLLSLDTRFNNKFYKTFVEAIREQDNFDFGDEEYNAKLLAFTHALIGPEEYINLICNLNDNDDFKLPKIYEDLYKSDLKTFKGLINRFLNDKINIEKDFAESVEIARQKEEHRIKCWQGDVNDWHNREGIVDLYYKDISTYVLKMRGVENYQIDKKLLKQIKNKIMN